MSEHHRYNSIDAFKNVRKYVNYIVKHNVIAHPTIEYEGTVKLHGTNAGVVVKADGTVYAQARNRNITPFDDNAGFAKFVHDNEDLIRDTFIDEDEDIVIFGEFAGGNIQSGVAINQLEKMFVIFDVKSTTENNVMKHVDLRYIDHIFSNDSIKNQLNDARFFYIRDFKTYDITIDFSDIISMNKSVEQIIGWVDEIGTECPVGTAFGVNGVGEGLVFKPKDVPEFFGKNELYFKAKDARHSASKVTKTVSIDPEVLEGAMEFVSYAVTENRVGQAIFEIGIDASTDARSSTGDVIQWCMKDIIKEEINEMNANNIDKKLLGKYAPNAIRKIFFKILDSTD